MPQVTLIFADGERRRFETASDEPIIGAARRAGVVLASDCEIGDCQTCRAHLRSGRVVFDEYALISLSEAEIARGAVLTCVSWAQEDVEIEVPYARSALIVEKKHAMTVKAVEMLSPTTARLCGVLPQNSAFTFHPGQYVNLRVPGTEALRSYSMASDPTNPDHLEFHIRLLPEGRMSNFIRRGDIIGSPIEIAGPKGVFYLRESDAPVLMIAGGTGLAPMMSMLHALASSDRAARPILLCFGVNRPNDLYGLSQLQSFTARMPNLHVRMAMVEPDASWNWHKGFVTDLVTAVDVTEETQIYLCGPPPMIAAARKRVASFGAADDAVFAEEFVPSGAVVA
jgi:benzoate/toluate 1,2-dioxygenase reductase subunit